MTVAQIVQILVVLTVQVLVVERVHQVVGGIALLLVSHHAVQVVVMDAVELVKSLVKQIVMQVVLHLVRLPILGSLR